MAATETYIGKPVARKEDAKLLTGQSQFIDDLTLPGMVWAAVVRSPYAHAKILSVDVSAAREAEGVVAAFSGADLAEDWAATLPCVWLVTEDTKQPTHHPLATDKVRYQGDGVAVVLAESRALAKDAAELVQVEYEELPAVIDPEEALADGAPILHEDLGTNHCFTWKLESRRLRRRLRRRAGHGEGALPPAAADPERDRAARRASRSTCRRRTSTRSGRRRRSRTSCASGSPSSSASPRRACA